jgi:HB1, ASXL, restriction endonuclease HTH domain
MADYVTFRDAAEIVLSDANEPLTVDDVVAEALRRKLVRSSGKTPIATMSACLYVDVRENPETPFIRIADTGRTRARRGSVRWTLRNRASGKH